MPDSIELITAPSSLTLVPSSPAPSSSPPMTTTGTPIPELQADATSLFLTPEERRVRLDERNVKMDKDQEAAENM